MGIAKTKNIDGKQYQLWGAAVGRSVYYEVGAVAKQLQLLEQNIHKCFHHRTLYNKLKNLKDCSSMFVSQMHSKRTDRTVCRMNIPGSEVEYFQKDGAAFVTKIVLKDAQYDIDLKAMRAPGAYRVELSSRDEWEVSKSESKFNTLHASLNGEVEDIVEVMKFIPKMIEKAYKNGKEIRGKGRQKGFTHLYMPGKNSSAYGWRDMVSTVPVRGSKEFEAAKQSLVDRTAACIEISAKNNDEVKWTVQGSGSEIFCDAIEKATRDNPNLNLSRQTAHFFNPHTNPMRIKTVVENAGGKEEYTSALRSKQNIAAMAKGHRQYSEQKIAQNRADNPTKSQMASKSEARQVENKVLGAHGMTVKIAGYAAAVGAAASNPAIVNTVQNAVSSYVDGLQNAPVLTVGASMAAAASVYQFVNVRTPNMIALGHLGFAALKNDRRLDQLTESNTLKAYDEYRNLKLGFAI